VRRVAIVLLSLSAVLLIAVVALVARSGDSHPAQHARVLSAITSDDSRIVELTLSECGRRLQGSVEDRADPVRVDMTTAGAVAGQGCGHPVPIVLQAPLGSRSLVDGSTGRVVTVQKVPASQLQGPLLRPVKRPPPR